ncbi:hypothetical protein [Fischerella sp. JS2]|uniref:hypothetical protein n=1 Tax=Fischerella sp. JS2 TaxID=2597771 RepID=UPI0028EE68FA|nr:hypothetical protein [Fischerella sp. JS2]
MSSQEVLEGYVVDVACNRKYPQNELLKRAREHTRQCGLSRHCIESGYGLVDEEGRFKLLDPKATSKVLDIIRNSDRGIQLRVKREIEGEEMQTSNVEEI